MEGRIVIEMTREDAKVIWDALHTFYADQFDKGILLKEEFYSIAELIKQFRALGFK